MTVPTTPVLYAVKFKGTGQVQVFPLINGTVLGNQIGTDFGTLESGTIHTTQGPRVKRRIIEFFGKTFFWLGADVRERNQGGTDNWGVVFTATSAGQTPNGKDSGWFIVHPGGRPTLVILWYGTPDALVMSTSTTDGVNWVSTSYGAILGPSGRCGEAIAYRDSIFWYLPSQTAPTRASIVEVNFLTGAQTFHLATSSGNGDAIARTPSFGIVKNTLYAYVVDQGSSTQRLFRFSGGVFVNILGNLWSTLNFTTNGAFLLADGDDLVIFTPGGPLTGGSGDGCLRITNVNSSPVLVDETVAVFTAAGIEESGANATPTSTWDGIVDNNTNPGVPPAVHFLRGVSLAHDSGSKQSHTWQYRALTHDDADLFSLGEIVTGGTSGATGVVTQTSAGKVHLTDVVGTFQSSEVLTGGTSFDTANSTSTLTPQPLIQNGVSISVEFATSVAQHSIGPYIPTFPAVRIELGINGVKLVHGATTLGPFQLNETITGGTSGATGVLFLDNLGNLIVHPTNAGPFQNAEVITGSISGASATMSSGPVANVSIPSKEVIGGTKHYLRVWGTQPDPVPVTTLYSSSEEEAPWVPEIISSITLEVGTPPGLAPTISGGTILNLPADDGVRVWSLIHDSVGGGFSAGDVIELSLKGV